MPDDKKPPFSELDGEKAALRKMLRARRAAYVEEMRTAESGHLDGLDDEMLIRKFPKRLFPRQRGHTITGYMPMGDEIDPYSVLAEATDRGMLIAMPRTPPKGAGLPLAFHRAKLGDTGWQVEWEVSAFGVREPPTSNRVMAPELMIVPLLGFDRRGYRIGYGAGHYDRTIAALRAKGPLVTVGVAFSCQEVDVIPTDDFDQQLDWIVTPRELIGPFRPPA